MAAPAQLVSIISIVDADKAISPVSFCWLVGTGKGIPSTEHCTKTPLEKTMGQSPNQIYLENAR